MRLQSSQSGNATDYSQFFIDPIKGFSFMKLGTGNGNVGIGTKNPSRLLDVAGDARVQGTLSFNSIPSGGSINLCRDANIVLSTCSSSLRYKTNVADFAGGMNIINRLRPISFKWKQDGTNDIGLGAEEVEEVEPLLTFRNAEGEIEGVKYNQLSAVFINAFKEQQAQIQQQRGLIERQQALAVRQQQQLNALKKLVCRSRRRAAVCK